MLIETLARQASASSLRAFPALAVNLNDLGNVLLITLVFTIFGLLVFGIAFLIMSKASPFSIRKEIEEDQNTALAIVMGAVILGIAFIIAAAIHG